MSENINYVTHLVHCFAFGSSKIAYEASKLASGHRTKMSSVSRLDIQHMLYFLIYGTKVNFHWLASLTDFELRKSINISFHRRYC